MARVGVIFGGRSTEHRVSVASARTVARGLAAAAHEVVPLGVAQDGCWVEPAAARAALDGAVDVLAPLGQPIVSTVGRLLEAEAEVLFPIIHGTWGEDGSLQGLAEMLDLPYVGTGVATSAIAMDKGAAKLQLSAAGIPVVEGRLVTRRRFEAEPAAVLAELEALPAPLFVKPAIGGSSVGIRRVGERAALADAIAFALRFDDCAVVEREVVGRELECAVLGYRAPRASVVGEIVPPEGAFYDYAEKYLRDTTRLVAPADLPAATSQRIQRLAIAAFTALGGWGMGRVDFLFDAAGALYLNEINTLPGFTDISMYPRLWGLSGLALPALVDELVAIAIERHADRRRLDEGIKAWLAELV